LAHDSGHNYAPNTAKPRLKIALIEATNKFEDQRAAPSGGCWGQFSKNRKSVITFFLIGFFFYFKQNKTGRNAVMWGIVEKVLSIPTNFV